MRRYFDFWTDSLQNARNAWQGLQKQVPVTRAAIAPQVKVQAAKTKVDIGVYEQDVAAYNDAFRALEFWQYSAGPEGKYFKAKESVCNRVYGKHL